MFAACATAEPLLDFQSNCRFFISSVIIHVPEAQKRDGVTVAHVNSCQWLTKVAHAHFDAVVKPDFVKEVRWPRCLNSHSSRTSWGGHKSPIDVVQTIACVPHHDLFARRCRSHTQNQKKKRSEKIRDSKPMFGKRDCNTQRPHTNINMATSGQERET